MRKILVFIFLGILILLASLILILLLSSIKINIVHFGFNNLKKEMLEDYLIKVSFNLFGKFKYLSLKIDKEKIQKWNLIKKVESLDFKKVKQDIELTKEDWKQIRNKKPNLEEFNLRIEIGTEDAVITSGIVFVLSMLASILFRVLVEDFKQEKHKFEITPFYQNQNRINLKLNCIINVKMVHIINILYILMKKRRVDNNERTSNRRSYDNCYEQYPRYGRRKHNYRGAN